MNSELKDAINFMINLSVTLLHPDKPLHKGLDPTFYHTLSYEGDKKLIEQFNKYNDILRKYKNEQT